MDVFRPMKKVPMESNNNREMPLDKSTYDLSTAKGAIFIVFIDNSKS
jgi:hypothetical protein